MNRISHGSVVAMALVASMALVGCSSGQGEPSAEPSAEPGAGLADFDPCAFLTEEDLATAGVAGPPEKVDAVASQPGCDYEGQDVLLSLTKNQTEGFAEYGKNNFERFDEIDINGRRAAIAVTAGSGGNGICSVILDAGGGIVDVNVTAYDMAAVPDPCGEAEQVARQIEPRLPA